MSFRRNWRSRHSYGGSHSGSNRGRSDNHENSSDGDRGEGSRRHPPHLRGKAIGMFYAQKGRNKAGRPEEVHLNVKEEKKISNLLQRIQNNDVEAYSEQGASLFRMEYHRHLQAKADPSSTSALQRDPVQDKCYMEEQEKRKRDPQFQRMMEFRRRLPSMTQEQEIVDVINSNQVVVISGETGCGKTTQVPQFILDSFISQGQGSACHIVCTQPRRISAISVAERVAEERAEKCGGNSSVGWQIRLESKIPRSTGSILYCTTGIVLQWLKSDSFLKGLSHIILDEIHERDLDSDFLMIILKDLLRARPDLKLVLMSATLNAQLFSKYFFDCPMVHIPGYTFPVTELYLEDTLELTGYTPDGKSKPYQPRWKKEGKMDEAIMGPFLRSLPDSYSGKTVRTLQEWNEKEIDLNLIVELLRHICFKEKEGAVLIFLPGWFEISNLHNLLTDDRMFQSPQFLLLPLHSMMPTVNQREIFNPPPKGVRKIVIATNIAETSITIDDVVYVIDSGFIKMGNFDVNANVSTLKAEWVAMANARQRRGRAGRVQPGKCFKLYTKAREMTFDQYCLPEMLRTRLETLCLKIKILKLGYIETFLEKAMNPPVPESVKLSVELLKRLNALDNDECLTPLGFHLARLPLDPQIGRMILFAAIFSCLDPVLTVAASLTFKEPFIIPLGKESIVDQCKVALAQNTQSDHLMLANAFLKWEDACRHGNDRDFCWRNFLSPNTLKMLSNLKKQFAEYLHDLHFLHCTDPKHRDFNRNSDNQMLVKAVICAGLYPNIAKLRRKKVTRKQGRSPILILPDGKATFHPKSVLHEERLFSSHWMVYYQKVKSTGVYLHDVTIVHPYALLFFGGQLTIGQQDTSTTLSMDNWITFACPGRVAQLIPALRKELDNLLEHKINCPGVTEWTADSKEGEVMQSIVDLLSSQDELDSFSNSFHDQDEYDEDD